MSRPACGTQFGRHRLGILPHDLLVGREIGLTTAKDSEIFQAARDAKAVLMTKDSDFVDLVQRLGSPPQVLWVTCGNSTNARLKQMLSKCMPIAISQLEAGVALIEITDSP